jgi:hypothetical protein
MTDSDIINYIEGGKIRNNFIRNHERLLSFLFLAPGEDILK